MSSKFSFKKKNLLFLCLLIFLTAANHLYYQFLSAYAGVWLIIGFEILLIALWMIQSHRWINGLLEEFVSALKKSSADSGFIEEIYSSISGDFVLDDLINRIISYQHNQKMRQQALLNKLKNSNIRLQRNSRITESIMEITSEILTSGEIDEILQIILDKAIEIIPNAQKGSILIYNGSHLEFRASHGYDSKMLKTLRLDLEELFQYSSESFYEPHIIDNVESFNKMRLQKDKFEILRKSGSLELKSVLSCAIQVDNEFLGVINLDSVDENHSFSEEDKPLIKHLAVQTGIALKNARLIEKILYLSRHDSLTGIYNRCYFEELLMKSCQQCKTSGSVFSLAIMDINNLKRVNDTYGHEAGDLMLKVFAKCVKENLSKDDIFSRYGGDEFAILFTGSTREQAEAVLNSLNAMFSTIPLMYCGRKITNISFSFGVAEFPSEAEEYNMLIKLADSKMYKNKRRTKSLSNIG